MAKRERVVVMAACSKCGKLAEPEPGQGGPWVKYDLTKPCRVCGGEITMALAEIVKGKEPKVILEGEASKAMRKALETPPGDIPEGAIPQNLGDPIPEEYR